MTTEETLILPTAPEGMLSLSPPAVTKARQLLEQQGSPVDMFLRVGVKGGGCSGFSYVLEFDRDVDPKYDRRLDFDGVKVVVDRKSLLFLAGTTLDYTGDLLGQGFEFKNPNVNKTCGCGTSFQV
jgi:iron-sulfur cluster assembly protein